MNLLHPDRVMFCLSLGPFSRALVTEPVFAKAYFIFLNCLAHFYVVGTGSIFPPQIKCISFAVRND